MLLSSSAFYELARPMFGLFGSIFSESNVKVRLSSPTTNLLLPIFFSYFSLQRRVTLLSVSEIRLIDAADFEIRTLGPQEPAMYG